jgi:hypothetical protein
MTSLATILRSQARSQEQPSDVAVQLHQAIREYMIKYRLTTVGGYYGDFLYAIDFSHRRGVSLLATLSELRRLMECDGMVFNFRHADCEDGESEVLGDVHYEQLEIDVSIQDASLGE